MWRKFLALLGIRIPEKTPPSGTGAAPAKPVSEPGPPIVAPKQEHFHSVNFIRDRARFNAQYAYFWSICQVKPEWLPIAQREANWALKHRARFLAVTRQTGVPWFVVAGLNKMEMGTNFDGSLLNGDPWNRETERYPRGHGPWGSWEEAAVYAIRHEAKGWNFDLSKWKWDLAGCFFYMNAWNGFLHATDEGAGIIPKYASPYIYSGTPFYAKGKRVEKRGWDGKYHGSFDKDLVSQQLGVMALWWEINKIERLWPEPLPAGNLTQ